MAKGKGRLKWLGLLLALMLVVGFTWNGQGLAAEDTNQPEQIVSSGTDALQTDETAIQQVYDTTSANSEEVEDHDLQTDQTVVQQAYNAAASSEMVGVFNLQSQPDQITLSWTADPRTTQTIAWRVYSTITGGEIQYLKQSEENADFSGAQEKDAVGSELSEGYRHFEVELDNLQPATTYVYRVSTDNCWSEPGTFTTAADTDKFSFMYMGDTHIGYDANSSTVWKGLLDNALTNYPELKFVIQSGDLVDKTENLSYWEEFFNTAAGVFDRIPLLPALGNHEVENPDMYLKSFALPQNGPEGLKERHYSFDYGNAHFAVLDSNLMGSEGQLSEAGIAWLESDLQNSEKDWKFVMFHHPPYGVDSRDPGQANMIKEKWVPVMERNSVDIVFVGHQHMYMRTYPLRAGQIQEKPTEGITYVLGNAGNKTYLNPEEHDYIAKVLEGPEATGYTVINIDGDVLSITTRGLDGKIMDSFKINKGRELDSRVAVDSVKLVDSSYQEISSVSGTGTCHLKAHINNYTSKAQTADILFQVRSGSGATAECGGVARGIVSLQSEIPAAGADVYADLKLAAVSPGQAYADVYVLNEAGVPIDVPFEYSFNITP